MAKKFKKVISSLLAVATLSTCAMGNYVSASYHDDELNHFIVSGYYTHNTATREKEDSTSASIRISSTTPSGCRMSVNVYGTYTYSLNPSGGQNKTIGSPKIVGTSSYYTYLPNYVWEDMSKINGHIVDNLYAYLGLTTYSTPNGQAEFYADGYWSPDSI